MNRRTFFGLLAGLAGVGALKPRKPGLGCTYYRCKFQAWFKYYTRPSKFDHLRIYIHKRHEIEKQS